MLAQQGAWQSGHDLTTTHLCRTPGCDSEAAASAGRHAYCRACQVRRGTRTADARLIRGMIATAPGSRVRRELAHSRKPAGRCELAALSLADVGRKLDRATAAYASGTVAPSSAADTVPLMEDAVVEHGASATRLTADPAELEQRVKDFFVVDPQASARGASAALGYSTPTVLRYMRRSGIPVKERPKRRGNADVLTVAERRERVRVLYVVEGLSAPQTAERLGIKVGMVYADLDRLMVAPRTPVEAQGTRVAPDAARRILDALDATHETDFGPRLRVAMDAARLGRRRLARESGVGRNRIRDIEHGRYMPSVETAEALVQALGVPLAAIKEPHACECTPECPVLTFSRVAAGHSPKARAGQPVLARRDRAARDAKLAEAEPTAVEAVGLRLRARRLELGLTQRELGARSTRASPRSSGSRTAPAHPSNSVGYSRMNLKSTPSSFFDLRPCACWLGDPCGRLTVGGGYARGCVPLPDEWRSSPRGGSSGGRRPSRNRCASVLGQDGTRVVG